jgi:hypothetical protein
VPLWAVWAECETAVSVQPSLDQTMDANRLR